MSLNRSDSSSGGGKFRERSCSVTPSKVVQFGFFHVQGEDEEEVLSDKEASEGSANKLLRHASAAQKHVVKIPSFNKLSAALYQAVLQNCQEKLEIMADLNQLAFIDLNLEYVPVTEKFSHDQQDDDILYNEWHQVLYKKFKRDVWFLHKIIRKTVDNLEMNGSFQFLAQVLEVHSNTIDDELTLLNSKKFNQKELVRVRCLSEREKGILLREVQQIIHGVGNIKDEFNDMAQECDMKRRYVTDFERSRREKNTQILARKEKKLVKLKREFEVKAEEEDLVHGDISRYADLKQEEDKQEILKWMDKYDGDMEKLENAISQKRIQVEKMKDDHRTLKTEFERRSAAIDQYLEHKRLQHQQAEELDRQNYAATCIQAWWRGTMYRRGLGPWRKKKRGKGSKKTSAKKR